MENDIVVGEVGQRHAQSRRALHLAADGLDGPFVAGPTAAGNTVVDVPQQHFADAAVGECSADAAVL